MPRRTVLYPGLVLLPTLAAPCASGEPLTFDTPAQRAAPTLWSAAELNASLRQLLPAVPVDERPVQPRLVIRQDPLRRLTSMRLSLFGDTGLFLNRLDTRCRADLVQRCSLYSLAFGVHGASANLQWRVDGARALVPDHEFSHDALHIRFQATYAFD